MVSSMKTFKLVLLVLVPCVFLATMIVSYLSMSQSGIFNTNTGNVSNRYSTLFTPISWAFSIWGVIYTFQVLILIYMICSIFVRVDGTKMYEYDNVFPISFLVIYLINFLLNMSWLFAFDRAYKNVKYFPLSATILVGISVTLYACIGIISYNMKKARENGYYKGKCAMYVVDLIFLQNGLGIYAGWTTVAQCLNIAISLQYYSGMDAILSAVAALSVLLVLHVGYTVLDLTLLDAYTRYLFIPYCVVAYALRCANIKNYGVGDFQKCLVIIEVVAVAVVLIKFAYLNGRTCCDCKCDKNQQHSEDENGGFKKVDAF